MAKGQIHLTPNGPARCSADPSKAGARGCPFNADGHFATEAEAEQAYATLMEGRGFSALGSSTGSFAKLRSDVQRLASINPPSLAKLQSVGARIDAEVFGRAGVSSDRTDFSTEELEAIGRATSEILKELQGEPVALRSKFHGPFARRLKEALSPIPTGASHRVSGDVYTETVNVRNRSRDGFHIHQAAVMAPVGIEAKGEALINPLATRGDLVVLASVADRSEIEDGTYPGFAVSRVQRGVGEPLQDGDSVLHAIRETRGDNKFIELLKAGVVDTDAVILPGQTDRFEALAPELSEVARRSATVTRLYAGKKPTGPIARGRRYSKLTQGFDLKDVDGESYRVDLDLYEIQEKSLSYRDHTIGIKNYGGSESSQNSVLLHEFSHAIQSVRPGGIAGERELFDKLSGANKPVKEQGYTRFPGFPDDYMGDVGGREVFTRASEALFYPHYRTNDYLYNGAHKSQEVRRWPLGTWALLGVEGLKSSTAQAQNRAI